MTFDDLASALAQFKAQYGAPPPQPLHISGSLWELLAPERLHCFDQIFGLRIIVDEAIPEGRIGYQDDKGNLKLL